MPGLSQRRLLHLLTSRLFVAPRISLWALAKPCVSAASTSNGVLVIEMVQIKDVRSRVCVIDGITGAKEDEILTMLRVIGLYQGNK